jgi:hypothetical protein
VQFPIPVADAHDVALVDSQHPGEPIRNRDLEASTFDLGDAARAIDKLSSPSSNGIISVNFPFTFKTGPCNEVSSICASSFRLTSSASLRELSASASEASLSLLLAAPARMALGGRTFPSAPDKLKPGGTPEPECEALRLTAVVRRSNSALQHPGNFLPEGTGAHGSRDPYSPRSSEETVRFAIPAFASNNLRKSRKIPFAAKISSQTRGAKTHFHASPECSFRRNRKSLCLFDTKNVPGGTSAHSERDLNPSLTALPEVSVSFTIPGIAAIAEKTNPRNTKERLQHYLFVWIETI